MKSKKTSSFSGTNYTRKPDPTQPIPPIVEIISENSRSMTRPLMLIDNQAYAIADVNVKVSHFGHSDKKGIFRTYTAPKVETLFRRVVIRGDGAAFGNIPGGGFFDLTDLDFEIKIPELPHPSKLWSSEGVKDFLSGSRPDPADIFFKLKQMVDSFLDFEGSLADQQTMCEMIACYVLSTWFLDAFNIIGFLWPNGERGAGKTNLLVLISQLSFLGQLILAGGTYASLRDLADCGATLCFDDAENLSDSKQSDPDKRAMLLAGNRRGTFVPLKEPTNNRGWKTRYVNMYCARAFSATRLPDSVLSSRTIIVPLTRTVDKKKGNLDPADISSWPCDPRKLIDDLWALAVTYLPKLRESDKWVGQNAQLTGRNLQPWRSILAVAAWLESTGVGGLWQKMHQLAIFYQAERLNIETSDFTVLVIRAIFQCAVNAVRASSAIKAGMVQINIAAATVAAHACKIIHDDDVDISKDHVTPRSVGRVMAKLRLREVPRPGGKGPRLRSVSLKDLNRLAQAYEIPIPDELKAKAGQNAFTRIINGTDGSNGSNGTQ